MVLDVGQLTVALGIAAVLLALYLVLAFRSEGSMASVLGYIRGVRRQRDPLRERVVRTVVTVGSLLITGVIILGAMFAARALGYPMEAAAVLIAVFALDLHVFRFLVRRLDIRPPRAFREVET